MKDESVSDALLRQFLLDKLDDEERERIESLFLTDSAMRDRVLAAEQDLIEDYLEDSLSSTDREAFVLRYAQTAEQQRKLRITRSIKDWAIAEDAAREVKVVGAGASAGSLWSRLWERLRLRPVFVVPIVAVVILAVVFAVIWVDRRREQSALEQEVARLNDPSSFRAVPSRPDTLVLAPGTLRSGEGQHPIKPRADEPFVELHLNWTQERFPNYQAEVRRLSDDSTVAIPSLSTASAADAGKTLRLRLPPRFLTRGTYRIQVNGIAADGTKSSTEEYSFTVVD